MKNIFFLLFCSIGLFAKGPNQEFTKVFNEKYSISEIENLEISNRYGDVNIITLNTNPDQLEVDVEVKVQAHDDATAQNVFNRININIEKHGSLVRAITTIESKASSWWQFWDSGDDDFTINYTLRIPKALSLDLQNKYGNIYCEPYKGKASINLKYGELYTQSFNAPLQLILKYGKGKMGACNDLDLNLGYGDLKIERAKNVLAETKYSKLRIDQTDDLNIQSKYDKYDFGESLNINSTASYTELDFEQASTVVSNGAYSDFEIKTLLLSGLFNHKYGDVSIEELGKNFEHLEAQLKYCNIDVGIKSTKLKRISAKSKYGDISYPDLNYKRKDVYEESQTKSVELDVGPTGASLNLESSYGSIRIKD